MGQEAGLVPTEDERRLVEMLLGAGPDVDAAVSLFRRQRLEGEARVRVPECVELPRFVVCVNWDHHFPGRAGEKKVRWVFDRRLWSVVVLHVRDDGDAWLDAGSDDILDVTESLAFANAGALVDVHGWGCREQATLPPWIRTAGTFLSRPVEPTGGVAPGDMDD